MRRKYLMMLAVTLIGFTPSVIAQNDQDPDVLVDAVENVIDAAEESIKDVTDVIKDTPKTIETMADFDQWVFVGSAILLLILTYLSHLVPGLKNVTDTQKRSLASASAIVVVGVIVMPIVGGALAFTDVFAMVLGEIVTIYGLYPAFFKQISKTKDISKDIA